MSINLLPEELKPKSSTLKIYKSLKKASIILVSICGLTVFILGGVVLVMTNLLGLTQKRTDSLKNQIINLEQTETRLVLIRDRLSKINELQGSYETKAKIESLRALIESTSGDVELSEIVIDSKGTKIKANFGASTQMTSLIAKISEMSSFRSIKLDSLKFIVGKGYEVSLLLI